MNPLPCLVFADDGDWIVFAPLSRLVLRTNRSGAERFHEFLDHGPEGDEAAVEDTSFAPTRLSIALSNLCEQRCVYCYGMPTHSNTSRLDPRACYKGLQLVANNAAAAGVTMDVHFHGVGEPTAVWPLFADAVNMVDEVADHFGVQARTNLCTGGQLEPDQASWIADRLNGIQISVDGPPDIHNEQRPRRDGQDSLARPLALARDVVERRKRLTIKATVTDKSVGRMVEIVDFVAREVGPVQLDLGMMFAPPWVNGSRCRPPQWQDFVSGFAKAVDRGKELGVVVAHPSISLEMLAGPSPSASDMHFCLTPPGVVTAFYDVPRERGNDPRLGVYGHFDELKGNLIIDHQRRRKLAHTAVDKRCEPCPCRVACYGPGGVKGRMPEDDAVLDQVCRARVGVLKELLRRRVPKPAITQEKNA